MCNFEKTWELYTSSWKPQPENEKLRLFEQTLAKDCVYTDPLAQTTGWSELSEYMAQFHQQIPGGHFETVEFMTHNRRSVARWKTLDGDKNVLGDGISYGEYNGEGKLTAMTGFFEVPAS